MPMAHKKVKTAVLAGTGAALCGAYLITRKNELMFYHYDIKSPKIPQAFDGFKVLHLSDLHTKSYGTDGELLTHACADVSPDVIVFTGDLISRSENIFMIKKKIPMMRDLLKIAPVYYVWGNHEADVPDKAKLLSDYLEAEGINVLRNEKTRITRDNEHIDLYGLELEETYYKNPNGGYKNLPEVTEEVLTDKLGAPDSDSFNLLLAHSPMPFESYADWGADLTLSGHCHGGIIRIGNKGLLSPERRFFPKYTKGLYTAETENGTAYMEVSAGLGKFRINNPESVSLCRLASEE